LSWEANATLPAEPVSLEEVRAARDRIAGSAVRTPLVRLEVEDAPAEIYLKLENLQPIGSFKIRGAANVMGLADPKELARGVYTASAGNMAQGVAWNARRLGVPCTAVVPETAPEAKLSAIRRLGADYVQVPFDRWWQVMTDGGYEPLADRLFIHPFLDRAVMAGNGTIGLEILEDLPDPEAIVVPFGGGGLSCGIASAVHALRPEVSVFASEIETAAPLAASLSAGRRVEAPYAASFVDGIGSKSLVEAIWPLARSLLAGSLVVSVAQAAAAVRLLAERNHVVAEGAGATPVAAALTGEAGAGKVVCVISGGNIDPAKLARILAGQQP
jgi:threonine dehydratase